MLLDINIRYQDIIFQKRLNKTQRQTLGQNIKKKTIINANKHTKLNKSNMDSMKNKSELWFSERGSSSCSTFGTRRVTQDNSESPITVVNELKLAERD